MALLTDSTKRETRGATRIPQLDCVAQVEAGGETCGVNSSSSRATFSCSEVERGCSSAASVEDESVAAPLLPLPAAAAAQMTSSSERSDRWSCRSRSGSKLHSTRRMSMRHLRHSARNRRRPSPRCW